MLEQTEMQKLLVEHLEERKVKNQAYSLRAFARQMGVSPSTLSEVVRGRRRISRDLAEKIVDRLQVPPPRARAILGLFPSRRRLRKTAPARAPRRTPLDMDQYYLIADWYYFAILSLAETVGFQNDVAWIAERLGLPKRTARAAVTRLVKLGMLTPDLAPTGVGFTTSSGLAHQAIRKNHVQSLALAQNSLARDPVAARVLTSVTMAIDPDLLPEAGARLNAFRDELCAFLESGPKKEVYKLGLQLFPLTQVRGK